MALRPAARFPTVLSALVLGPLAACSPGAKPAPSPSAVPASVSPSPAPSPQQPVAGAVDCPPDPTPRVDWSGRHFADEAEPDGQRRTMSYQIDLLHDADGVWRGLVSFDGQMAMRRLVTCGEPSGNTLTLRFVGTRSDDMGQIVDFSAHQPVRFPDGSWQLHQPALDDCQTAIPAWAGRYTLDTCDGRPAGTRPCWSYVIDVGLAVEGWKTLVSVDGPGTRERLRAWGEDGKTISDEVLTLVFAGYAAGDAHTGAGQERNAMLAHVRRSPDGSVRIEFDTLVAPPGPTIRQATSFPAPARR
jgi:hypothetical protein